MNKLPVVLSALLLVAAEKPPRSTGLTVDVSESLVAAQGCIMRQMAKSYRVDAIPLEDGVAIDGSTVALIFAIRTSTPLTVEIREKGQFRRLSVLYRHPVSARSADGALKDFVKNCGLTVQSSPTVG